MIPDPFNPFGSLAGVADNVVADGWTRMMLSIWNAGVWLLKIILRFENYLLTPDISESGPAAPVYQVTLWLAATLLVVMLMIQLGTAAVRRDGKSISRVLLGTAQFVIVWVAWIGYGVAIIAACAALNKAFLLALFQVDDLAAWEPWSVLTGAEITDAVIATVLGWLGMLVWLAGITHLIVMLTRAGALVVLAAVTPISAAGLVSEVGRDWFWKSFRWFHAAAFSPVLMTLLMGTGIRLASGAVAGEDGSVQASIANALLATVMILMSAVSPMALFKLLAFTDPGTSSGAAVRTGMAAVGGIGGLLQGGGEGGSGAASQADTNGRASGEQQAEDANSSRMISAAGTAASLLSPVGAVVGTAMKAFAMVGGAAASITSDVTNQMGVGHNTYQPDWVTPGRPRHSGLPGHDAAADAEGQPDDQTPPQDQHDSTPEPASPGGFPQPEPSLPDSPGPASPSSGPNSGGSDAAKQVAQTVV